MRAFHIPSIGAGAVMVPGVAMAAPRLTLSGVFLDAAPLMKVLMIVLMVAALWCVIITVAKVMPGRRLSGGSAFVSALRLGGPLVGVLGAAFVMLMGFVGSANHGQPVPMNVLAPGYAEAALLVCLGLVAGVVAVICHWLIDARIDRAVLED